MSDYAHQQDSSDRPFVLSEFLERFNHEGMIPISLMGAEMALKGF